MISADVVLAELFQRLWTDYKRRVPYAARYETMVEERGGRVQNDHVAFRTFNCPMIGQPAGVESLSRIFEPLGYTRKDQYLFADKKLTAWHWEHRDPVNPKLFISQLEVDRLTPATASLIKHELARGEAPTHAGDLKELASLDPMDAPAARSLAGRLAGLFARLWAPPSRAAVDVINKESQYAAWTLLHGNEVNHFTAYINEQNVREWPDIETTASALRANGIPMKQDFEGEAGSKLRQTSTQAIDEKCDVTEANGQRGELLWSYAYYELAERGLVPGRDGKPTRFQAFLGEQATNLFDMTKRS